MSKLVVLPDGHPHLTSPIEGEGQMIPPPLVAERAKAEGAKTESGRRCQDGVGPANGLRGLGAGGLLTKLKRYKKSMRIRSYV